MTDAIRFAALLPSYQIGHQRSSALTKARDILRSKSPFHRPRVLEQRPGRGGPRNHEQVENGITEPQATPKLNFRKQRARRSGAHKKPTKENAESLTRQPRPSRPQGRKDRSDPWRYLSYSRNARAARRGGSVQGSCKKFRGAHSSPCTERSGCQGADRRMTEAALGPKVESRTASREGAALGVSGNAHSTDEPQLAGGV
ncbi:hypothetical protein C8Q74DRAFT_1009233 [Fomes fomentarius]|nr:hypothetical protein C8Q74DRAFT_1009233 [Fomes fomentarius]